MCALCRGERAEPDDLLHPIYVVNCRKAVKYYLYNFIAVFYLPQKSLLKTESYRKASTHRSSFI